MQLQSVRPRGTALLGSLALKLILANGAAILQRLEMQDVEKCTCAGIDDAGWDDDVGRCMRGAKTTCEQCPSQQRCAQIRSVAGDGIQAFGGDCRLLDPQFCSKGDQASLSFPSAVAIDEQDNLYVADHGNNRIRMLSAGGQTLETIAGTGEVGFSGDGGPARKALLRHPEGIAVRPYSALDASGRGREVYFSDFQNQRIRKLVLDSAGYWKIFTVAGTGKRGDDAACDVGCHPLNATFDYPRALAFSSSQDLFFVDSGNKKIRRLTLSAVDSDGHLLKTFIMGQGSPRTPGTDTNYGTLGAFFLPGHWEEPNEHTQVASLYNLNIDQEDNLWYTDGFTNRLMMAPLHTSSSFSSGTELANQLMQQYVAGFAPRGDRTSLRREVLEGLLKWLPAEFGDPSDAMITETPSSFSPGKSYWMYGAPEKGDWCHGLKQGDRSKCKPAEAQTVRFQSIMGTCFDGSSNMYIADMESSQLLYLSRAASGAAENMQNDKGERLTTETCPCLKYWHVDEAWCRDINAKHDIGTICYNLCRENPDREEIWKNFLPGPPPQFPPCETQDYCATTSSNSVPWCFVDYPNAEGSFCESRSSGFCGKKSLGISFDYKANVAVLGSELRREHLAKDMDRAALAALNLTTDLWMNSTDDQTSILLGFVSTDAGACTFTGLQDMPLQTTGVQTACQLHTLADVQTLESSILLDGGRKVSLVYSEVVYPTMDGNTIEACQDQCMLDETCKSFIVALNSTTGQAASSSLCFFFTNNVPYSVYQLNRNRINNTAAMTQDAEELAGGRQAFGPAVFPLSRLFNGDKGIHVTADGLHSRDMVAGPYPEAGLLLAACQDLCVANVNCYAIAYPGCYLLNSDASARAASAEGSAAGDVPTMVYVKRRLKDKVRGVAGFPSVYGFNGENVPAEEAQLNRPLGCAVDSKGSVHVVDSWNQRVREVSGYHPSCLLAHTNDDGKEALEDDVQAYITATDNVTQACSSDDQIKALFEGWQEEVAQHKAARVQAELCKVASNDTAANAFYQSWTSNTLVLCELCDGLEPRPPVCPSTSMCLCRDGIVHLLQTEVYKKCKAPSTYNDNWHLFATSYISCWWMDKDDSKWLNHLPDRTNLEDRLRNGPSGVR